MLHRLESAFKAGSTYHRTAYLVANEGGFGAAWANIISRRIH